MDAELPDELLYGRAGYLYALLYLNTEIASDTVPQSIIKEVGLFFLSPLPLCMAKEGDDSYFKWDRGTTEQ